jgi:recombination protein RecA
LIFGSFPHGRSRQGRASDRQQRKGQGLESALAQIEKQFGKGTIMRLGEGEALETSRWSPPAPGLDIALGVGGLPRGRVIEIYGPESSGRPRSRSRSSPKCNASRHLRFVDAEHALDVQYAQKLGVNLSDLLISQPDTGEQALEIVDSLVRSGAVDLIVVDSVAALTPKAEIEGEMGDSLPGLQARLMSQALRKLGHYQEDQLHGHLINQIRMNRRDVGCPKHTGGSGQFYASVLGHPPHRHHQEGRRGGRQRDQGQGGQEQGLAALQDGRVRHPVRRSVSREGEIIDMGVTAKIVDKSGAWYAQRRKIGQGRDNARSSCARTASCRARSRTRCANRWASRFWRRAPPTHRSRKRRSKHRSGSRHPPPAAGALRYAAIQRTPWPLPLHLSRGARCDC